MRGLDKDGVDKILLQLEENEYLHPQYKFYRVKNTPRLLGRGGFSSVYEMYDEKNPKLHYAAKVIGFAEKSLGSDWIIQTTQLQYFLAQQSENIVRILDLWEMKIKIDEDGNLQEAWYADSDKQDEEGIFIQIILMEKLDNILSKDKYGNTALLRNNLRNEDEVVHLARQIGQAVLAAHKNNILHRDIKLENIFWDENLQQYKLGDFGIAKFAEEGNAETVAFTDGYGAPEIERRLTDYYNATADIYSFGITLYLLLNDLKFPGSAGYHVNLVQYSPDFVFPAPINASEDMARMLRKMCSYRIEDRYQSIEEVLMELEKRDGCNTESGFAEEDEDFETVTYKEDNLAAGTNREPKENEKELTRQERKQRARDYEARYAEFSVWRVIVSAVLFALLFESLSPGAAYVWDWQFWVLPVAVFAESVLLRAREFHVEFGVLTIGTILYSIAALGINIPQVVFILIVLEGTPSITAGCAIGCGLWIAQTVSGEFSWLGIFHKWDLGWIIIILLVAVIHGNAFIRAFYDKITEQRFSMWVWVLDKIGYVLIIAGMILLLLGHFNIISVPEIIKKLHFVRVGIGIFLVERFYIGYYERILDSGEEAANEYLDE